MITTKPCPKCGGQPEYQMVGDFKQFVILRCQTCGYVAADLDEARITTRGARKVWNNSHGRVLSEMLC